MPAREDGVHTRQRDKGDRKRSKSRMINAKRLSAVVGELDAAMAARETSIVLKPDGQPVTLTNLAKPYFPAGKPGARTKGDMLRYYLRIAPVILPHLRNRPVVLTRYPDGAEGKGFYVQGAPEQRPAWTTTCTTSVSPPKTMEYLVISNTAMLLWAANLGGFEIHPWYSRCSAVMKPDFLVIDLDPVPGVSFPKVQSAALHVRDALEAWKLPCFVKTSGATGLHLFVPIKSGPTQKEVHAVARTIAEAINAQHPKVFTTEYRIADRPRGRVLLDHNQNSVGHHLAGAYSVRPKPTATVSTPLSWSELEDGAVPRDFTIATVPERLASRDDPWAMANLTRARVDLVEWQDVMRGVVAQ
jgi:bifunctional non-homologous end joining protein LigD